MSEVSKRVRRVSDLIHKEVALLLKQSVNDPRLHKMIITSVDLSPDLSNARIYYVLPDTANKAEVDKALIKASGFIRHELSTRIDLRYTPKINFRYDDSISRARHILSIMEGIEKKDDE